MTQPAPTDTAAETGAESPVQGGAPTLLPDNAASSIAPDLLATLPEPDPTNEDDGEEVDASLDDGSDEEDEPSTGEGDPEAPDDVSQYVAQIAENPRSITSVPRAKLPDVVGRVLDIGANAINEAFLEGLRQGEQRARTTATLQDKVRELDQFLEDGDAAAFKEAAKQFPGGEKNYYRVKADLTPIPDGSPASFQQQAHQLFNELAAYPEAQQFLASNWNYRETAGDIARLARDVGVLMERARAASTKPAEPSRLQQRREAQEQRKKTPKPDVSQGIALGGSEISPEQLQKLSPEQVAQLLSTPEGKAKLQRAAEKLSA